MIPGMPLTRRVVLGAGAAALIPRLGQAQSPRRIAFLAGTTLAANEPLLAALRQGLSALGYGDRDVAIEIRYADGHMERLPGLAAELVRLEPDILFAGSDTGAQALKRASATIPIVFATSGDPVGSGLVASLARPGGNVTGLSLVAVDIAGKLLELLKVAVPFAERIAVLVNPGNPRYAVFWEVMQGAARTLHVQLLPVEARSPEEIPGAFRVISGERADALFIQGDPILFSALRPLAELALRHRLPAVYTSSEFAAAGGLMSYGADVIDHFRRAAGYVDRILKGARPADLPVEQPTTLRLVLNLKTAHALGLTIPPPILQRADEVIE